MTPVMTKGRTPGRRRLLVLEKDDLIRDLIVRWLGEAGYLATADEDSPGRFALVIADVPDPGKADEVLQSVRARYKVPILVTSGRFTRDPASTRRAANRLGVAKVLPKPFTCDGLVCAVKEILNEV